MTTDNVVERPAFSPVLVHHGYEDRCGGAEPIDAMGGRPSGLVRLGRRAARHGRGWCFSMLSEAWGAGRAGRRSVVGGDLSAGDKLVLSVTAFG